MFPTHALDPTDKNQFKRMRSSQQQIVSPIVELVRRGIPLTLRTPEFEFYIPRASVGSAGELGAGIWKNSEGFPLFIVMNTGSVCILRLGRDGRAQQNPDKDSILLYQQVSTISDIIEEIDE